MGFKIADKENLLSELTCAKCNKLLSVFPIYTSSSIGNVCGRCTQSIDLMISNNCIERNTAYESIAKYVLFPCSNRKLGCEANLKHDEVANHEKCCSYRQLICPFNVDACNGVVQCDWKGEVVKLNNHVDISHTSREIKNSDPFKLNMDETDVKVNFIKIELHNFIIFTKYDGETNKFYCLVMCCDREEICKNYTFELELSKADFRVIYPKSIPKMLIDTSEALEKVYNMRAIDISTVITLFGNLDSHLICRISISKNTNEITEFTSIPKEEINSKPATLISNEVSNPSDNEKKLLELNKSILIELECPVCLNYMKTPIYICSKGHSLCEACREKIIECPICRDRSFKGNNFALQTLSTKVLHSCKYSHGGCTEILNVDEIKNHQIACILRTDCPLIMFPISCDVKEGILNPIRHIYENHSQYVLDQKEVFKIYVSKATDTNNYNVIISDNEIFVVCHKYNSSKEVLMCNILHLGQKTNVPIYRYVLEFVNENKFGSQLLVKKVCQSVFSRVSDVLEYCLSISSEMLYTYEDDDMSDLEETFEFHVKIEKI